MVLTTYLDSADESDPFGPTQLDILVCGSRFHTGSSINCFSWWRQRFQAVPFKLLYCCILLFSCFLFPIYLWCTLTFRNQLSELFSQLLDLQFLSTLLWRVVPSIGTIVGLTLFGWCMFSCSLVLLFSCGNRYCSLRLVVWFRGSESVLFGSYIVAGNSCSEARAGSA